MGEPYVYRVVFGASTRHAVHVKATTMIEAIQKAKEYVENVEEAKDARTVEAVCLGRLIE